LKSIVAALGAASPAKTPIGPYVPRSDAQALEQAALLYEGLNRAVLIMSRLVQIEPTCTRRRLVELFEDRADRKRPLERRSDAPQPALSRA
jgi:hypothetical protein